MALSVFTSGRWILLTKDQYWEKSFHAMTLSGDRMVPMSSFYNAMGIIELNHAIAFL